MTLHVRRLSSPGRSNAQKSTSPPSSTASCQTTQNIGPLDSIKASVAEFHQRRRHLIDCLRYLLDAAVSALLPDPPRLYLRLEAFVRQELVPTQMSVGADAFLASPVFKQVESLAVAQAQTARQGAQINTVPPSATCPSVLFLLVVFLADPPPGA